MAVLEEKRITKEQMLIESLVVFDFRFWIFD